MRSCAISGPGSRFRRIHTPDFLAAVRDAGGSGAFARAIEDRPRDPLRWPHSFHFHALGPFPVAEGLSAGFLPVVGGQSRDQLAAGVRLSLATPFAARGLFRPFFWLPRAALELNWLRRLHSGADVAVLAATFALARQAALELRAELGGDARLVQAEASFLDGRSAFAGPFRLARVGIRREEDLGLDLVLARTEWRLDATQTLLHPRHGTTLRVWGEAGRDRLANQWAARGAAQAAAFVPLGPHGLLWAGMAAAASRRQPQQLSAEADGWLTAWPDRVTERLTSVRLELLAQPRAPAVFGWTATAALLAEDPRRLFQSGPTLRLFGETPFSVQVDLPLWTAGGPDAGFGWRWAVRIGPRVPD